MEDFEKLDKEFEKIYDDIKNRKKRDKEIIERCKSLGITKENAFDLMVLEKVNELEKRLEELERRVNYDCVKVTYGTK